MSDKMNESAKKIQKFWKCYIDRQVFKYYCRLIDFRSQGDPGTILKCINPKETELFDSAFGAKVKFRLGGEKFPPNIYYKIFTSRPIQDLCANSPKNYCHIRRKPARILHNNTWHQQYQEYLQQTHSNWYERIENNGWRQISDRMLSKILYDPISTETGAKPVDFVHNKNQRIKNRKLQQKKRKIEWLRKLYKMDQLELNKGRMELLDDLDDYEEDEEEEDEDTRVAMATASIKTETKVLVKKAAESLVETYERRGEEFVEEWAVDELLKWTSGLNYDEYYNNWCSMATTLASDWKIQLNK